MLTLFADETGIAWDEKIGFFMYGGLILDPSDIAALNEKMFAIKEKFGIEKERPLKWNNKNWNGSTLDPEIHKAAKSEILNAFIETDGLIIVCCSPHRFYHDATQGEKGVIMRINPTTLLRTHKFAINDLLEKFSNFMGEKRQGIVIVDKFATSIAKEMTAHCEINFPYSKNIVHPVIQLDDSASIPLQVTDIILGAIQCSLKDESTLNFLADLRHNFWSVIDGEYIRVSGYGFNIYPLAPRYESYQRAKRNLRTKFHKQINA